MKLVFIVFFSLLLSVDAVAVNRVMLSNGVSQISQANTTESEVNYVSGVTSSIQTQLNSKESSSNKATDFSILNNTLYATTQAIEDRILSATASRASFYFASSASDIATYSSAPITTLYSVGALTNNGGTVVTTSPTLLKAFATNSGYPNVTSIQPGIFTIHYDAAKASGSNNYYTYAEIYKRTSGGTETLIATTDNSAPSAVNTTLSITVTSPLSTAVTLNLTDRIVVKIYAVMAASTATVTLYWDDSTSARVELPDFALGYVPEDKANKSTDGTLSSNSDTLYPSEKAVKTYADTKQSIANLSTSVNADQASNTKYSSVKSIYDWAVGLFQTLTAKDSSGGYAGLTLFKINFKNAANTFTSFLTNANTAARTYTFQDRSGTIADDTDLATKATMNSDTYMRYFVDFGGQATAGDASLFIGFNSGTASQTISSMGANATENTTGVVEESVSAVNDRNGRITNIVYYLGSGSNADFNLTYRSAFKTSLPDGTDTVKAYIGFATTTTYGGTSEPTVFLGFRYDPTVNSGKWQCVNRSGGSDLTATDSTVSPTADQFAIYKINVSSGGVATFYVDGTQVCQISSSLVVPSNVVGAGNKLIKTAGSGAKIMGTDYVIVEMTRGSAR